MLSILPPPVTWLAVCLPLLLAFALLGARICVLRRRLARSQACTARLKQRLALHTAVLDSIPQPIYVRDAEQRLITCNRRYEELVGASLVSLRGRPPDTSEQLADVVGDIAELSEDYRDVIASGRPLSKARCLHIQGAKRHVLNWVAPLPGPGDAVTALAGGWVDLTERHDMLAQLAEAKARAEAASRAKSSFLASISHDIRTPMNAVAGMLELTLKRPGLPPEDHRMLATAHDSALALLALIDDILDLSKMEAGKLRVCAVPTSLPALVDEVLQMLGPVAARKHLPLVPVIDAGTAPAHKADPLRFKQILGNLVSNAIRFTDHGEVRVHLRGGPVHAGKQEVELTVSDTGIGIASADQARLFQPFEQAHDRSRPQSGGTGLGLAICRRLVAAMGGRIRLESEPGAGTRVQVTLRLPTASAPAAPVPTAPRPCAVAAGSLHVLVVDDHAPNRLLLKWQCEHLGHRVDTAADGREALARLTTPAPGQDDPFDLIICDCAMPVMDGLAFARTLRERNDALARVPVIGCTASAVPEDHHAARQAGMDGVLVKPVGLEALGEAVRTYARAGRHRPASMPVPLPWPARVADAPSPAPGSDRWCEICQAMNVQCDRFRQ
ncbi:Virulence sensor protein BvgS [Cupriavidus yeoncheonensis]|uniref:Virulence sensor protein BvgS n=1 Tax=Cupriavidus yeoncheonensis TaxID=1462994 RepID=A0A916J1E5_9BURK|nr:ATP-binding protein [Cupriavidus yeoncheonensis]CAG2157163.1 Virulence sensor protein BvgS [Cupriavidus yeoncheonensis]